ncbi:hypothetical protein M422DRAFT_785817 [Sphaerobolus stellatus SS14]|uniref:enoyl-[acyl-carrier-protein] reductase n=1 Tax=Sphaerobolus stellatus (strain SS14) TaxID=990650 RepID=A0A0C9U6A3_SPHS4|nr:hypothetical protein M422DRAFT_785817 [Sphaerobolus stellatus SS14]
MSRTCFFSSNSTFKCARFAGRNTASLALRSYSRAYSMQTRPSSPPKAIVYTKNGPPQDVLKCRSIPSLSLPSRPPPGTLNVRFLLSPINPADLNVVEGVYPSKPTLLESSQSGLDEAIYIGGNEGLAQVLEKGEGVEGIEEGDWVVMVKSQAGTWIGWKNVAVDDVVRVPKTKQGEGGLTEAQAATMTVNPPTAYGMLTDFVKLKKGDWVVQNGANSAVGQAVIQIASHLGFNTINFVRSRSEDSLNTLKSYLHSLGATHVYTYDDLSDRSLNLRGKVKEWTGGKGPLLGLNCVGGKETSLMASLLGQNAHLVSYGAMSKQPLSLPTSLHIFKNLTSHGYWQTRWYETHSREDREKMMNMLVGLMENGKLKAAEHEIVSLAGFEDNIGQKVASVIKKLNEGGVGKKMLLKFEH